MGVRNHRWMSWQGGLVSALTAAVLTLPCTVGAQAPARDDRPAAASETSLLPVFDRITPSFSTAPRSVFRRRGPRGARYDYARQTVWLSANVHDLLPRRASAYWPSPLRVSGGRRGLGAGMPAEYVVGLDLDASRLPGSHPVWMHAKQLLHAVRLPGPAIVMGPAGTRAMALYW